MTNEATPTVPAALAAHAPAKTTAASPPQLLFDLPRALAALASGETTSVALLQACLARMAELEPRLHAIAWCDPARSLRLAAAADASSRASAVEALHGLPIGVKDVFDTADIPTEYGSPIFEGRVPGSSAAVVRALEAAGAIIVAKTVTTPLGFLAPGPTTNPWDARRTPGGSSMGSAAAVAAGIVPGAIGTQSSGSVIRPAAFCGIVGFKPTGGRLSTEGALEFSRTLDQVGSFASSIEGVMMLSAAMACEAIDRWQAPPLDASPRFAAVRTKEWGRADRCMQERFDEDVRRAVFAGAIVVASPAPRALDDAVGVLKVIAAYEAGQALGAIATADPQKLSAHARAFFAGASRISRDQYADALARREEAIREFDAWVDDYDALLAPPTVGEAPGLETTGDPRFCSPWSLVGAPAAVVPTGFGPNGLPLGLQLVGARNADARLLAAGRWIEHHLDARPRVPPYGSARMLRDAPQAVLDTPAAAAPAESIDRHAGTPDGPRHG